MAYVRTICTAIAAEEVFTVWTSATSTPYGLAGAHIRATTSANPVVSASQPHRGPNVSQVRSDGRMLCLDPATRWRLVGMVLGQASQFCLGLLNRRSSSSD